MDTPEKPSDEPVRPPLDALVLVVGGPLLSLIGYGLYLALIGVTKADDGEAHRIGLLGASVTPVLGSLLLRGRVVVRLWLGLLFGLCGAAFFLCAGFPVWLKFGPGWMD